MSWQESRLIMLNDSKENIGLSKELKEKLWKPELGIEELRKSRMTVNLDKPKTSKHLLCQTLTTDQNSEFEKGLTLDLFLSISILQLCLQM